VHVQPRQPMAEIALAVYSNIPIAITAIVTSFSASRCALEGTTEVPCRQEHFRLWTRSRRRTGQLARRPRL